MSTPEQMTETASSDAIAAFLAEGAHEPVVMLSLLQFTPDGGAARYMEYAAVAQPLLARAGAETLYVGSGTGGLMGDLTVGDWDLVVLVRYPTRQAVADLLTSPEYREVETLRGSSLLRSVYVATEPRYVHGA